jgi:hypothetical protein
MARMAPHLQTDFDACSTQLTTALQSELTSIRGSDSRGVNAVGRGRGGPWPRKRRWRPWRRKRRW